VKHSVDTRAQYIHNVRSLCHYISRCRRRREMYCGHARLYVCMSVCLCDCPRPHAHTIARTRM